MPELRKGTPLRCWQCWWREGGRCYNEKLAAIPTEKVTYTDQYGEQRSYTRNLGNTITTEHFAKCLSDGGFGSKRAVLSRVFEGTNVEIVIASEENLKAEGKIP